LAVTGSRPASVRTLLSFRGLYNAIYRRGSRPVHGSIASLVPYIARESNRLVVSEVSGQLGLLDYALVSPPLAMTLTVVGGEVRWIDVPKVRELNDRACRTGPMVDDDLASLEL
jgi:hypothetical protein